MIIITTHLNADFDCIGAMIGVRKMHPEAHIVFPGSQEPAVREFLKSGYFDLHEKKIKNLDTSSLKKIILVDTQNIGRLGAITDLIEGKNDIEIELIDHHQRTCKHPAVKRCTIMPAGSATTIVVKMLQERNIPIEPKEATLMALGIYEDTGFLLFPETNADDLTAAAHLLESGADLRVVSTVLKRGLNSEQILLYNDFITNSKTYTFRGEEVTIATARRDKYIPDAALVVHQYCDSEKIPHFYALIEMEDRILLIGRSRVPSLNAGIVAEAFGGGGHASASSAAIKDMTLYEAKEKLLDIIQKNIAPAVRARDIMSKIVFTAPASMSVEKALEHMNRSRINAFPLTEGKKVVGALTRQIVDAAIYHGMGKIAVREIMLGDLEILSEDADPSAIQKAMIEKNLRFVLIGRDRKHVKGIITRMALFRNLYEEQVKKKTDGGRDTGVFTENIRPMMKKRYSKEIVALLRAAGEVANMMGIKVYLVGGMVRDLILNEENTDVDLVVEGNGIQYAKKLAKLLKGVVTIHPKFQTAVIALASHLKIDVASSRTEYYEHPASLPTIERGMIRQDLYRRDFTINTLAIDLSGAAFGTLVDYFGGRRDIREGKIRALQSLSFIEDPTRAYRAIRFAARFGFEIAKETQHLIGIASKKGIFERLSGRRIMKELELIFDDEHAVKAIRMIDSFHLLEFISKDMRLTKSSYSLLEQIEEVLAWYRLLYLGEKPKSWNIYLMGLCDAMDEKARTETAERLGLSGREKEKFLKYKFWIYQFVSEIQRKERLRMSDVYFLCKDLPLEIILFLIAKTGRPELKKALTKYLLNYRKMKLEIDGEDLKSLGLKPGPGFADLFRLILKAKIEGRIRKKEDEMSLALKLIRKRQTT